MTTHNSTNEMYVRKTHHLPTGRIQAQGRDLPPRESIGTLVVDEISTIEGLWDTITLTAHSEHKVTIHARGGAELTSGNAPDVDITFYMVH